MLRAFVFRAVMCVRAATSRPWSIPTASPVDTFGVGIEADAGASPQRSHSPSVCMTSTANCASAASRAARENDNPLGTQSFYRAAFCPKRWQRFKSFRQTPAPPQGSQSSQKLPEVSRASMLTLIRGRKTLCTSVHLTDEPRISQRRKPSSSSFLEAGREVLLQAEQIRKEPRAKPALGEHCKPHSTAGVAAGRGHLFFGLESRTGNEISCLMVQLLQALGLMSCYRKQQEREEKASEGNFMAVHFFFFL